MGIREELIELLKVHKLICEDGEMRKDEVAQNNNNSNNNNNNNVQY